MNTLLKLRDSIIYSNLVHNFGEWKDHLKYFDIRTGHERYWFWQTLEQNHHRRTGFYL